MSYYDSYAFMSDGLVSKNDFSYDYSLLSPMVAYVVSASKGKLTGKVSAVDGDMSKSIKSVSYYNRLGMLLQQYTANSQ